MSGRMQRAWLRRNIGNRRRGTYYLNSFVVFAVIAAALMGVSPGPGPPTPALASEIVSESTPTASPRDVESRGDNPVATKVSRGCDQSANENPSKDSERWLRRTQSSESARVSSRDIYGYTRSGASCNIPDVTETSQSASAEQSPTVDTGSPAPASTVDEPTSEQSGQSEGGDADEDEEETIRRGIDVSRYQGSPDWGSVGDYGISFAIISTGDGYRGTPLWLSQATGAANEGIEVSFYHFLRFGVEPAEQAALMVSRWEEARANGLEPKRYWLDVEDTETVGSQDRVTWLHQLIDHLQGIPLGVYSGAWY